MTGEDGKGYFTEGDSAAVVISRNSSEGDDRLA